MPNTQFRKRIIAVVILFRLVFMKYFSKPSNPKLANIFFKSGMIEAWGRGFEKIKDVCGLHGGPLPEYEINESGIMVLCKKTFLNAYVEDFIQCQKALKLKYQILMKKYWLLELNKNGKNYSSFVMKIIQSNKGGR